MIPAEYHCNYVSDATGIHVYGLGNKNLYDSAAGRNYLRSVKHTSAQRCYFHCFSD